MPRALAHLHGSFLLPCSVTPRSACSAVALLHEDTEGAGGDLCSSGEKTGAILLLIHSSIL